MNTYLVWDYVAVGALGLLVGLGELVSRYRDEPYKAVFSIPAGLYLGINVLAALGALYLFDEFDLAEAIRPVPEGDAEAGVGASSFHLASVLVAGTSAMAFFRSAFFTVRVGGADLPVGPSTFLLVILDAADRGVDRQRAKQRAGEVSTAMEGVAFGKAYGALPMLCLDLMQNLTDQEQDDLGSEIGKLFKDEENRDEIKTLSLGLKLLNLVGKDVLGTAVTIAQPYLMHVASIALPAQLTLAPGETASIGAAVRDAKGQPLRTPLEWASASPQVATVDASGYVRAVAPGTARITARADRCEGHTEVVVDEAVKAGSKASPPAAP